MTPAEDHADLLARLDDLRTDDLRARRQLRCSRAGHTLDRGVCTSCGLTVHPARPAPEESHDTR